MKSRVKHTGNILEFWEQLIVLTFLETFQFTRDLRGP